MQGNEVQDIFRNLVKNRFMREFDYTDTQFSFQAVYYKTAYSYCCCTCAYENEFVDYISETGDLYEAVYEKIIQSIMNGKCPHVDEVPDVFVRETSIFAIHVAAVVGTEQAIRDHLKHYTDNRFSGIYGLDPYVLAVSKNNISTCEIFCEFRNQNLPITCSLSVDVLTNTDGNRQLFYSERMSVAEICLKNRNLRFLNSTIYPLLYPLGIHIARGLGMLLRSHLVDLERGMLHYMSRVFSLNVLRSRMDWIPSAVVALVYDKSEILETVVSYMLSESFRQLTNSDRALIQTELGETCFVLQRKGCESILLQHGIHPPLNLSDFDKVRRLVNLLHSFYDNFCDEIKGALGNVSAIHEKINLPAIDSAGYYEVLDRIHHIPRLSVYLNSHYELIDARVIEAMLELGADVNHIDKNGFTPLIHILKSTASWPRLWYYRNIREAIELLIYQNPDIHLNKTAVENALLSDLELMNDDTGGEYLYGKFVMDAKEHAVFDHNNAGNYAFNFLAPLLIESGFPLQKNAILYVMDKNLHPAEKAFLKQSLDVPRSLSLQWCCRDVLRKHFSGRNLHRFVESSSLPEPLKDYLLLKNVLKCFDKHSHLSKIPEILLRSWEF